ncbi:MAG TPA: MFS transporter [Jatrophihabitantaceae bacterium]|jgi:MFS family permease
MTNVRTLSTTRLRWVLGLTSTAYFMVVLDALVVITALPQMQQDLHADLASLQWTVNSYGIAFAAGIITAAALGDRFGRRRIFNVGLALFTLSSAACALAPNIGELVVARTVQGLGAAVVMPLSLTILTTAFPRERRGMIVGIYGGLAGLAVAAGPIVGGLIAERLDWHWIFWLNVPIGLLALALSARLLPESHGGPGRLDLVGVGLISGGVFGLVWALVRANDIGLSSPEIVGTLLAGGALLLGFLGWEQRVAEPMVPMRLFRTPAFAAGNLTTFLMSGATFAAAFLITQEFQFARGYFPDLDRSAAAAVLRHPDDRLADRRRAVRPNRPTSHHADRPCTADRRLDIDGCARIAGYRLGGNRRRTARRRHWHLDGTTHCAHRRSQCSRRAGDGQGVRRQASTTWNNASARFSRLRSPAPCSPPTATSALRPR